LSHGAALAVSWSVQNIKLTRAGNLTPSAGNAAAAEDDAPTPFPAAPDDGLSAFLRARPRLFGIAFRIVGCAAEAEDIVQEAWLRWQTTDRSAVRHPVAFLVTATTRLAINVLQSARARR